MIKVRNLFDTLHNLCLIDNKEKTWITWGYLVLMNTYIDRWIEGQYGDY